jgi:hypothetical protein
VEKAAAQQRTTIQPPIKSSVVGATREVMPDDDETHTESHDLVRKIEIISGIYFSTL